MQGETSVRILTSVREKDVFVVQSGSPKINDTIMELLIMISACKGGSANKITGAPEPPSEAAGPQGGRRLTDPVLLAAVLPYFPYSRQSKKKSHRGAITARMLANLLSMAGVKHVITVDLHASQMQGFFKCPVDNLHAEPLIARWIRHNVPNWKEAIVVSKNAGGTKRVTSLADALKLNFGIVTTDKKRGSNMSMSLIMGQLDELDYQPILDAAYRPRQNGSEDTLVPPAAGTNGASPGRQRPAAADPQGSPRHWNRPPVRRSSVHIPSSQASQASPIEEADEGAEEEAERNDGVEYNDQRAHEVTHGRLVQGHIVPDDFPSPTTSAADTSIPEEDPMVMSHASSFFNPELHALGGSGDAGPSSDEEEDILKDPTVEHMITLVGDVRNQTVFIVDDMIDKPGSWIAAAETVVKKGFAKKVYCIATHGVFGADCLETMQACDCIHAIVVTNSYPIHDERATHASKLVVLDLSFLLAEAIRRNHYGESISPLFQHIWD